MNKRQKKKFQKKSHFKKYRYLTYTFFGSEENGTFNVTRAVIHNGSGKIKECVTYTGCHLYSVPNGNKVSEKNEIEVEFIANPYNSPGLNEAAESLIRNYPTFMDENGLLHKT